MPRAGAPRVASFVVTYRGFSAAAKSAFQRAVDIWARQARIASSVPITINARFERLGSGILGSAGPNFIWRNFSGAPQRGTWYPDALANKLHGSQLDAGADILASFSSAFPNWHFGSGAAPAGKYDFTSVVLHEIGHGLGFLGAGDVSSNRGTVRYSGMPFIYDRYTENRAGKLLLTFANNSTALSAQLRGGNLFFDSALVRSANGGLRARLYAPSNFEPGSSYSHLDEATFRAGNPNSLMTPQLGQGETIRSPGGITLAVFDTLGW
ncbi:MAG: hypothetical protein U1E52_03340 [Geminicoccaceae bacterium]